MKRILIVNVNWLGDTLFATPFIWAIRENYPESHIVILTHPRCSEILEGNPHIDEIIIYDERGRYRGLVEKFSIISKLKSEKFDTAFILRRSLTRSMLVFLSKIPQRIGFDNRKTGFLLTKKIPPPPENLHRVEHFLSLLRPLGINPRSVNYEFFISDEDRHCADELLKGEGLERTDSFTVINPGGNWDLKRWPAENFARLGDEIIKRLKMRVVLTGAEKDMALCKDIAGLMEGGPILLCGKTNLKTLGAVFKRARWVISNDSGPMHIAVAVKTPVVALFGPTSPQITGPYGDGVYKILYNSLDCKIPCYNLSCEDARCMKAIRVEDVVEAMV